MWQKVRISSDRRGVLTWVAGLALCSALAWPGRATGHPWRQGTQPACPYAGARRSEDTLSVLAERHRLALRSPDLTAGRPISIRQVYDRYGCEGGNISPALAWRDPPAGTRSFAVLMFDADAPGGGWWHWAIFDIPARVRSLRAGAGDPPKHLLPSGAIQVRNDFGSLGYGGPCPPPGPPHHYHLMLYALRLAKLGLDSSASAAQVAARVQASALGKAEIVRPYGR